MRKNSFMKKFTAFILVGTFLFLTGCQGQLSDKFDEEEVKNTAKDIVTQVNEGNVESVYNDIFSPVMKNAIALDTLQENLSYTLDKVGDFESFEKIEVAGTKDKDTGTEYATVMVLAKYEEGNAMFTISFDEDMECAGFFIK